MTLKISSPAGELEADYYNPAQAQNAALLCHPHPSYGGSMHDAVLALSAASLDNSGADWAHLRFNFRGVGKSTGSFDEGVGEQDDLVAAWDWLRAQNDWQSLTLIGYSFGLSLIHI